MKNKAFKILYSLLGLAFIAAFVVFIVLMMKTAKPVNCDLEALTEELTEKNYVEYLVDGRGMKMKRNFGLISTDYPQTLYFTALDIMDIRQVLVIDTNPGNGAPESQGNAEQIEHALAQITEQNRSLAESFAHYGTTQHDELLNAIIGSNDRYVYYVAGENAEEIARFIKQHLER